MPPSTPPPLYEERAWTPRTPRFAPIDEPDEFAPRRKPLAPTKTPVKGASAGAGSGASTSTGSGAGAHNRLDVPAAHPVPLTPAQTPVNRKEVIEAIDGIHSSARVLFPSHTPARGSGRTGRRGVPATPRSHRRGPSASGSGIVPMTPMSLSQSSAKKRTIDIPKQTLDSARPRKLFTELEDAKPRRLFTVFNDQDAAKRDADGQDDKTVSAEPLATTRHNHPYQKLDPSTQPGMWYIFRGKKVFRPFAAKAAEDLASLKPRRLFADQLDNHKARGPDPHLDDHLDAHNSEEDDTDVESHPVGLSS